MITDLDERSQIVNKRVIQGAPIDETWTIKGEDWSGTYVAQMITTDEVPTLVASMTATAVYTAPNTQVSIFAPRSTMLGVAPGTYRWAMRDTDGWVPFRGMIVVIPERIPLP